MGRRLAGRRVHDQLDLAVDDPVLNIGLAFVDLVDPLHGNARRSDKLRSSFRGDDFEAVFIESSGNRHRFLFIPVADGKQYGTL